MLIYKNKKIIIKYIKRIIEMWILLKFKQLEWINFKKNKLVEDLILFKLKEKNTKYK